MEIKYRLLIPVIQSMKCKVDKLLSFRTRRVLIILLKAIKLTVTQSNKQLQEGIENKNILNKKSAIGKMYT